jgi:hypothetical protein
MISMNTCFDRADLVVSAHDPDGQAFRLAVDLHPGQGRILEYVLRDDRFPFRHYADVVRWCVCFGLYTLLGPLPHPLALMEAKMNIFQDERFEKQKDILAISIQKYLTAGKVEVARRLASLCYDEYSQIQCEYWRVRWLSTLKEPIEQLKQFGVEINIRKTNLVSKEKCMEPLDNEVKEIIELHTLLSSEYAKCPLSAKDLRFFAGSFAELLRARLHQCLATNDRRKAESLVSEIQASMGGIAQPLLRRLQKVTVNEMRLFNREWNARYPPRPGMLSKAERQKAARMAYERLEKSLGQRR